MRPLLVASLLLAACGHSASSPSSAALPASTATAPAANPLIASWQVFADPGGRYQVRLPSEPKEEKSKVPTSVGEMDLTMYMAQDGDRIFMVATSPLELPEDTTFDVDKGLAGARNNAMENMQAEVQTEKDIMVDGLKGKQVEFTLTAGGVEATGVARFVVRGAPRITLYQAMALSPGGAKDLPLMRAFVESMEIID